jgi:hypothetical protein
VEPVRNEMYKDGMHFFRMSPRLLNMAVVSKFFVALMNIELDGNLCRVVLLSL